MTMRTVKEIKGTLTASVGRVLVWKNSKEAGKVSIAVPGDRAVMTTKEARELATWLVSAADAADLTDGVVGAARTATLRNLAGEAVRRPGAPRSPWTY